MKNLHLIPDAIISATEREFIERVEDYGQRCFNPDSQEKRLTAIIDRLAGAYLDCLHDRDEWKALGEAVQRQQRAQEAEQENKP